MSTLSRFQIVAFVIAACTLGSIACSQAKAEVPQDLLGKTVQMDNWGTPSPLDFTLKELHDYFTATGSINWEKVSEKLWVAHAKDRDPASNKTARWDISFKVVEAGPMISRIFIDGHDGSSQMGVLILALQKSINQWKQK